MRSLVLAAAFAWLAVPAGAQQLSLEINNGRVNLEAHSVSVRQILAEWARLGGTRVVGADKIAGAPLTLTLVDVSEERALDVILRSVAGYMAAPRAASAAPGASHYDRIVILATSTAPPPTAATRPGSPAVDRRLPPRPPMLRQPEPMDATADDADQPEPDQSDTGVAPTPVFTFPQPGQQGGQMFVPGPSFGTQPGGQPVITLQPDADGQPMIFGMPAVPSGTPGNTFTIIGSPTPGAIQQPPPQPQPGQPAPVPVRPPGQE